MHEHLEPPDKANSTSKSNVLARTPVYKPITLEDVQNETIADDLLVGGFAIAKFIYGSATIKNRRKVFAAYAKGRWPISKPAGQLVALKSQILEFLRTLGQFATEGKGKRK